MSNKMNVVMVGTGGFGNYRRLTMRESGLFKLLAAYDYNRDNLALAEKEDGAKPIASYAELLKTPGAEAVVISTGAKFHAEQALAAMEKGLHVFVEKPICATPQELKDLLAMQKKTGRVVGMGHNDHSSEAGSVTIKEMIDRGDLGTVATFEKTTAHSGGLVLRPGDWRADPDKNPGGMLFQCGVHAFHELMYYFGPVQTISCMMRYDVHTTQTADVAICHLKFRSGLIGSLNAYHVTPYRHYLAIFGTKKSIYRDDRGYHAGSTMLTQPFISGQFEPQEPLVIDRKNDPYGNIRSFYNAVRQGGEPYPSLRDGARAVSLVFAGEESAKLGRPVEVQDA